MKTTITPILGRVLCPDQEIDGDFKGQPNSTRWVFDVEHEFDLFPILTEESLFDKPIDLATAELTAEQKKQAIENPKASSLRPKNALRVRNSEVKVEVKTTLPWQAQSTLELFHIQLAEHRTGRVIQPEVFSFSIGPMSESFYEAKPHIEVRNGLIHIVVRASNGGGVKYRIAIDTIHSSSR